MSSAIGILNELLLQLICGLWTLKATHIEIMDIQHHTYFG